MPLPASFRQTAPVACEGFGLAAAAGYVNVVALGIYAFRPASGGTASALPNLQVPVSHMSGDFSRLGIDFAKGQTSDLVTVGVIIGGFLFGAAISGAVIGDLRLHHARRYGALLAGEGLLLLVASGLWEHGDRRVLPLCAMACGMQNAMTGFYRGMTLRTTHVTGWVTDIGTDIGAALRGHGVRRWRLALGVSVLSGYFLGGLSGGLAFLAMEKHGVNPAFTLTIPACGCLVAGVSYVRWLNRHPEKVKEAA